VRTESDGPVNNRQPFGTVGSGHTVNVATEQFTQHDEPITEQSDTVTTWTAVIDARSDCSAHNAGPNFSGNSQPDQPGPTIADPGDSVTIGASGRDTLAA